jgi:hypothetical protein
VYEICDLGWHKSSSYGSQFIVSNVQIISEERIENAVERKLIGLNEVQMEHRHDRTDEKIS